MFGMFGRKSIASKLGPDCVPVTRDDASIADVGSDTMVYSVSLTTMVQLDQTGALIWKLCDGRRSVGEIISLLSEAFPDSASRIQSDVYEAIEHLRREAMLTLRDGED